MGLLLNWHRGKLGRVLYILALTPIVTHYVKVE
jgi:hypothetical protein